MISNPAICLSVLANPRRRCHRTLSRSCSVLQTRLSCSSNGSNNSPFSSAAWTCCKPTAPSAATPTAAAAAAATVRAAAAHSTDGTLHDASASSGCLASPASSAWLRQCWGCGIGTATDTCSEAAAAAVKAITAAGAAPRYLPQAPLPQPAAQQLFLPLQQQLQLGVLLLPQQQQQQQQLSQSHALQAPQPQQQGLMEVILSKCCDTRMSTVAFGSLANSLFCWHELPGCILACCCCYIAADVENLSLCCQWHALKGHPLFCCAAALRSSSRHLMAVENRLLLHGACEDC